MKGPPIAEDRLDKRAVPLLRQLLSVCDEHVNRTSESGAQGTARFVGPTTEQKILVSIGGDQEKVNVAVGARLAPRD